MDTTKYLTASLLLIMALFMATSVRAQNPVSDDAPVTSQKGHYRVQYHSKVEPIPLNKIHSWTLQIETADGKPVDGAHIAAYGGMPAHKHGFPTSPKVTQELGNGKYLLEGLKFSMSGRWELWLTIRSKNITDKAVINIVLP